MRKRILIPLLIVLALLGGAFLFHLSRPSVAFVESGSMPPGYDLPKPRSFFRYRMTRNARNADLVIVAPDATVPDGIESYLFGREAESGENPLAVLQIDEKRMWEEAVGRGRTAVLYEASSTPSAEISSHLRSIDASISEYTYTGRISGANAESIRNGIAEIDPDILIVLTPSSAMQLLRSDHPWRVVMDIRDAAAMETTAVHGAVSIDWNTTVDNLLSGDAELSYAFLSL